MRTTLTLSEETHGYLSYYAHARGVTLSTAVEELIQKAQAKPQPAAVELPRSASGLLMFRPTGHPLTPEMVKEAEGEIG